MTNPPENLHNYPARFQRVQIAGYYLYGTQQRVLKQVLHTILRNIS